MKKRLQKISMAVAAIVLFAGIMLLSIEKNDYGQWEVATVSSFAQGGESGDCDNLYFDCDTLWQPQARLGCSYEICPIPGIACVTVEGTFMACVDGPDFCLPDCVV